MKIEDLQDGQMVTVRTARAGGADEEGPKWSDWEQTKILRPILGIVFLFSS